MGGLSFTDLSFSEGILWQGCGLEIFGKSGVDYKMEKQYPGISWVLLFAIPNLSTSFNEQGKKCDGLYPFHKGKRKTAKRNYFNRLILVATAKSQSI